MKKSNVQIIFVFLFLLPLIATSQEIFQVGYFSSPLDIKHYVTGSFGEPRPDHLHSGIDFSTNQKTGLNIYAVADGYISRVKVSPNGYGRVVYITHPNGFVSVYAHLSEFNVVLEDYVRRKQYEKESFEIELFPDPALFYIKKGDIIGYSGNTGSSTGPHLHFEIRNEKTERPINTALFGIYATDINPPVIKRLKIFPYKTGDSVNGKSIPVVFSFEKTSLLNNRVLPDTIKVVGSCFLGIMAMDFISSTTNDAGIYSLEMNVNAVRCFSFQMDSFAFDESRYVNDMIDYDEYARTRTKYLLLRNSPANSLTIYNKGLNRGIINFSKNQICNIEIKVNDYSGNSAVLQFVIAGKPTDSLIEEDNCNQLFVYDKKNHFETSEIKVDIDTNVLFNNILFKYAVNNNPINSFSSLHSVHNKYVPLIKPIMISVKADLIPEEWINKAILARLDGSQTLVSIGGEYENGWISGKSYRFGDFLIAIDTTPPIIKALNFSDGKSISSLSDIKIKVTDNLSGINKYRVEINGKWVLSEYDAKNDLLTTAINEQFPEGKLELLIKVSDRLGNENQQLFHLLR